MEINEGSVEMVDQRSRVIFLFVLVFSLFFNSTLEQQQELLRSRVERFSLLQLRSSLGLRAKEWPIKLDPCRNWTGIECRNGRVVGINISGFKRTRLGSQNPQFSVDALQNFTRLVSFNASNFALPASIPEWFATALPSLQVLDLRSCSVTGVIPSGLGNVTSLTNLYLSHNNLTGSIPSSLGQLLRLEVLDLSRNSLTGPIPASFASLRNLTSLNMSTNYLSGNIPPSIGTLSRLNFLYLSGNSLSSSVPAQLGDLSNLVDFDIGFNSLSGTVPPDLRGLRNLQKMVIGNNSLSGPLPTNLFSSLTQLQFVVLSHNAFTDALPSALWSLPRLQFLDASGNNFTGSLPDIRSNANATAAVVNLSQNSFYGSLTGVIRRFSSIDLSGNFFQGNVPDYLQANASLSENCLQRVLSQRTAAECTSFYSARGLTFDNFGFPNATQPPPPPRTRNKSQKTKIILAAVLGSFGLVLLVSVVLLLIFCTRKRGAANQKGIGVGPVPAAPSSSPPGTSLNFSSLGDVFTYQQILQATGEFDDENLIKNGHSGDFFRGLIEGGIPVIIKRVDLLRSVKKESCPVELDFFSKVSHTRLVPLLGHCLENENEKFLVYKYMPNGDLSSSLFRKNNSDDDSLQSLDWITRLKIAIGAAEGLSYLHHECTPPFVHRYFKIIYLCLIGKLRDNCGLLLSLRGFTTTFMHKIIFDFLINCLEQYNSCFLVK